MIRSELCIVCGGPLQLSVGFVQVVVIITDGTAVMMKLGQQRMAPMESWRRCVTWLTSSPSSCHSSFHSNVCGSPKRQSGEVWCFVEVTSEGGRTRASKPTNIIFHDMLIERHCSSKRNSSLNWQPPQKQGNKCCCGAGRRAEVSTLCGYEYLPTS